MITTWLELAGILAAVGGVVVVGLIVIGLVLVVLVFVDNKGTDSADDGF